MIATNDDLGQRRDSGRCAAAQPQDPRRAAHVSTSRSPNEAARRLDLEVAFFFPRRRAALLVAASVLDLDILSNFTLTPVELFIAKIMIEPDGGLEGLTVPSCATPIR